MAAVQKYSDADFAMFEPKQNAYDQNAARKMNTAEPAKRTQKQPDIRLLPKKKKSLVEAKQEMQIAAKKSMKLIGFALFFLGMFAMLLYNRLRTDELTREIDKADAVLTQAQGENVRLSMALDSMISLEHVEDYAKNNLGMTKVEGYQIEYIDLSGTDEVVKNNGHSKRTDSKGFKSLSITEKIKAYFQKN